jgi:hypothetical protein
MSGKTAAIAKTIFLSIALLLCLPSPSTPWSRWEHEVIAEIAQRNLTGAARRQVELILGPDIGLRAVATWADRVRYQRRFTAPWHWINYPLELDEPDYDVMNTPRGNVVWAIEQQIDLLKNPAVQGRAREEALKFLVHFIGDLHQPLHCGKGEDRGGNDVKVTWEGKATNLHSVWDGRLAGADGGNPLIWAGYIQAEIPPGQRPRIMRGRPYDWMIESHRIARDFCYPRLPRAVPSAGGPELAGAYANAAQPIVRERLARAGLRLALVLNNIFGKEAGGKTATGDQKPE